MKLFFKILAAIVLISLALIFILPIIFKGEIIELAKKEINNNVNAKVDFADMDLSLIKNFPNFSLSIEQLVVIGKNEFEHDTLANVKSISIVLDLISVIKGDSYEVKHINIDAPNLKIKVLENGKVNYNIAKSGEESAVEETSSESTAFHLSLKRFTINDANLLLDDQQSGMHLHVNGLDNTLSGNFTKNHTNIRNNTRIKSLTFRLGGIDFLSDVSLSYDARIEADLKNRIYTLGKNELKLNDLNLNFNGSVSELQEGLNLVLTFKAPDNNFKSLLSLVSALYAKEFEGIEAEGKLSVDGMIKGIYSADNLPAFSLDLSVENGVFGYPDLPQSVTGINISSNISNIGGTADNTIINVSDFSLMLGQNPFKSTLIVKTPVSDPDLDAQLNGKIDLAKIKDFYPVEDDDELNGTFMVDVKVKGRMSTIEEERYNDFIALGSVLVQNLNYKTGSLTKAVEISNAQLNFSPQYLDLVSFKMTIGKSNLSANGKVRNYLAYAFKNGNLKGNLTTNSTFFNLDELTEKSDSKTAEETTDPEVVSGEGSVESKIIEIPDKVDFTMNSSFDKLIYDNIEMDAVIGRVEMKNKILTLNNLQMNVVEGQMTVNGSYSTQNPGQPKVNLNFGLKNMDIPAAYNKFAVVRTYLPVAKKTNGTMLANFNLSATLDEQMMPVYETMNGRGRLSTSKITINDLNTFLLIAEALKITKLQNLELDKLDVGFKFIDGKMAVNPFEINYNNISAEIEGWTGFDQSIGYVMNLNIPREELGSGANQVMENLLNEANKLGGNFSLPENISFDVLIGGTLSKPTINTGLAESGNDLVEKAKEEIIKEISEEALAKARQIIDEADKQAKAIVAEAKKQANYLKENADDAVASLKNETQKQTDSLIAIGKKNGFVAELAAKEAARQLNKEADNQAKKLLNEADGQADKLISEAEKIANTIKQEAQKQADALLKK